MLSSSDKAKASATLDESKNDISRKKQVRFLEVDEKTFTPLAKLQKNRKKNMPNLYKNIRDLWERQVDLGNIEHLRSILQEFKLDEEMLVDFFKKEGRSLLTYAMIFRNGTEQLKFICDYVPSALLKETLRDENYYTLSSLLLANTGLEKSNKFTTERRERQFAKIRLLLTVDPEGIKNYMESEYFKSQFTPAVQACCREALEEYKKNNFLKI